MSFDIEKGWIVQRRTGKTENPFVFYEQPITVVSGRVTLDEIPDDYQGVQIENGTLTLNTTVNGVPDSDTVVINYELGELYFDSSFDGQQFTAKYYGTGKYFLNVKRIFTNSDNGNVTETLQTLVDTTENARGNANQAANSMVHKGTFDINATYETRNIVIDEGTSYMAIQGSVGKPPKDNPDSWKKLTGFSWKGVYSSTTEYNMGDFVIDTAKEEIFMSLTDKNTGKTLVDGTDWALISTVKDAVSSAQQATTDANEAAQSANTATTSANTAADNANTATVNANTATNSANTAASNANTAATYATDQGDYAKSVGDENKTNWLLPVSLFADISATYPTPVHGDTVMTTSDGKIYRYTVDQWENTQQYTDTAIADAQNKIGDLTTLNTTDKSTIANAINENVAQLAERATKEEVANALDGSPKGTYATLSDLQTAFPSGANGVYIIQADGHIYSWDGSNWADRGQYQSTGIAKSSITNELISLNAINETNIDFLKVLSNNLVDKSKMKTGGYYDSNGVWKANASFQSSPLILVDAGESYIKKDNLVASYWDGNFNFISSFQSTTFTVPTGAKYVRLAFDSNEAEPQLNKGTLLLPYDEYKLGSDKWKVTNVPHEEVIGFDDTTTENLFNKDTVTRGYKLDTSGNPVADASKGYSDFIEVDEWGIYYPPIIHTINYYDASQQWVMSGTSSQPFTVPTNQGIKYAKINVSLSNLENTMFVRGDTMPSAYIPHTKKKLDQSKFWLKDYAKSNLYNKKWNAYGDSITARGFGYHAIIKTNVGGMTVRNYGFSGRTLASRGSTTDASYPPGVFDYVNMDNDADIISMFIGTNDFNSQVPLGASDSSLETEFYGALNIVALGMIEKFPGKKICFMTPTQRAVSGDDSKAIPLIDYVNAMKEIGEKFGIPVFDLHANCGLYPKSSAINSTYFESGDGLHPNIKGHGIIAPRIQSFLESL